MTVSEKRRMMEIFKKIGGWPPHLGEEQVWIGKNYSLCSLKEDLRYILLNAGLRID